MPYVEAVPENEAMFTVQTPRELANISVPAITGRATLNEHVAKTLTAQLQLDTQPKTPGTASRVSEALDSALVAVFPQMRELGGAGTRLQRRVRAERRDRCAVHDG